MMRLPLLAFFTFLAISISYDCSAPKQQQLAIAFSPAPFDLGGLSASFAPGVRYGEHDEASFDIFIPEREGPVPLVIHIHGGSFVGGDKADIYGRDKGQAEISALLAKGIAFASINYRLLQPDEQEGIRKPLGDARRCLQFIRHHAANLKIDANRIGLYGASAGAGLALWLALSDELADPTSGDPVQRESTRVKAVAAYAAQATYDLLKWESTVFKDFGLTMPDIIGTIGEPQVLRIYGISSLSELHASANAAYRAEVDLLALLSPDDPPLWIENPNPAAAAPQNREQLFHHYKHGEALFDKAQEAGIPCMAFLRAKPFKSPDWKNLALFFETNL
jgi:para-nitrobenzyl esterase